MEETRLHHRAQFPVECPRCHWRCFQEVEMDASLINPPVAVAIREQLEAWLASRCPAHLGPIMEMSKN